MEPELKAFLASSCLHMLVAGSAVSLASFSRQPETPLVVECTIDLQDPAPQGKKGERGTAALFPAPAAPRAPRVAAPPPGPVPEAPPVPAGPAVIPAVAASTPVSLPRATPAVTPAASAGSGGPMPAASIPGRQGSGPVPAPDTGISVPGSSVRGEDSDSGQKQYLKEHFAAIRDLIARNLRYPGKARRMGWCGKLMVEFVVRESGEVDGIRVVRSSGIALLDCNAVETVRRSAPFPRPPASARLVVPVEYRLE